MSPRLLCLAASLVLTASATAADWPQWRGPDRNEVSLETGIRTDYSSGAPKLLWTYEKAGNAYSGPAVVGTSLYCLGGADGKDFAFALDTETGKEKWRKDLGGQFKNAWGDGPRGTPTVDGERMFVIRGDGDLLCLETRTGQIVWQKNMKKDMGGNLMSGWGYSESPLVDGEKLIVTPGGSRGALAALDKKSGKEIWRSTEWKYDAAYSSAVATEIDGVRMYIQQTAAGKDGPVGVVGVDAATGKKLWSAERPGRTAVIPSPIVHENFVYTTAGYGSGCQLLKIVKSGDGFTAEEVYANKNMTNHHGGVVLVNGYVYGFSDGKGWVCQDFKTGAIKWEEKGKGRPGKGSVTCAAGHLFCFDERSGNLHVVLASPDGYKETGVIKLPKQTSIRSNRGAIWTHPVIANGKLYLRDQDLLFCFDVKQ